MIIIITIIIIIIIIIIIAIKSFPNPTKLWIFTKQCYEPNQAIFIDIQFLLPHFTSAKPNNLLVYKKKTHLTPSTLGGSLSS